MPLPSPNDARLRRLLLFIAITIAAVPAAAQPDVGAPAGPTAAQVGAFFDERLPELMEAHRVPGAIVAVVTPAEVLLARGYGFAALAPDRPATVETPFATGSVAKLFTWTAVMQLVELGRLDLDQDVNAYLDFEIPEAFGQPITLRHLLSHTPGFEDRPVVGLFSRDATKLPPLGEALAETMPARLWAPGVEAAYSNYGSALAGYVVERVSGVPFERFVRDEILEPLGMARATFEQPLPTEWGAEAAMGYVPTADDGYTSRGAEYVTLAPAGGMVMSALDAARFMRAYLGDGAVDGRRILEPETVARMRTTLFRHAPDLPGNAYGFWESDRHGERILQHGGDTQTFHTQLSLFPDRGLGVYLATNAPGGAILREVIWEAFLDRFFPVAPTTAVDVDPGELAGYAGMYGVNRVPATTLGRVAELFQILSVRVDDDALVTSVIGLENRWLPQGDGVFSEATHEGQTMRFTEAADGRTVLHVNAYPMMVFRSLRWFETPLAHGLALSVALLALLSGLIAFPLQARRARRQGRGVPAVEAVGRGLGVGAAAASIAFVVLFVGAVAAEPAGPAFGLSPVLVAALWAGLVAAALVAAFVVSVVLSWATGTWRPGARVHATLVAAAGALLVAQMAYWNLLGFRV